MDVSVATNLAKNKYRWNKSRGQGDRQPSGAHRWDHDSAPSTGKYQMVNGSRRASGGELERRARRNGEVARSVPQALMLRNVKELSYGKLQIARMQDRNSQVADQSGT